MLVHPCDTPRSRGCRRAGTRLWSRAECPRWIGGVQAPINQPTLRLQLFIAIHNDIDITMRSDESAKKLLDRIATAYYEFGLSIVHSSVILTLDVVHPQASTLCAELFRQSQSVPLR